MNQRIRELSEQAREYATTRHPVSNIVLSVNSEKFEEKFAELIVRECGKYLESEAERLYALFAQESDPNFQSNFEICAKKCYDNIEGLKEHFGVKE